MSTPTHESLNVALVGPHQHGKTMVAACLVKAQEAEPPGSGLPPSWRLVNDGVLRMGWTKAIDPRSDSRFLSRALGQTWGGETLVAAPTVRPKAFRVQTDRRRYAVYDCPGIPRLAVRTTYAVMTSTDVVVLVVSPFELGAAEERQLDEALRVAHHVRAPHVVVLLNKGDHASSDGDAREHEVRVRALLARSGVAAAAIVHGAAGPEAAGEPGVTGTAARLLAALDALPPPPRLVDSPLYLSAERAYRIAGRGMVVAGVVTRGRIRTGDVVRVIGARRPRHGGRRPIDVTAFDAPVLSLRSFDAPLVGAEAGDAIGVLLRPRGDERQTRDELSHGVAITSALDGAASARFVARLAFVHERPTSARTRFSVHAGHAREAGRIVHASDAPIEPGATLVAPVALETPMFVEPGMRFFLRTERVVALGEVVAVGE